MPIDHFEISPYPHGRFVNGQFQGERLVECNWGDVGALLAWFDSYPSNMWPYPEWGGWSASAPVVSAVPKPKPGSQVTSSTKPLIAHEKAWIYLTYGTSKMKYVGGHFVHEEIFGDLGPHPVARPNGLLWGSDDLPIIPGEASITTRLPQGEYCINHYKLAAPPSNASVVWGMTNAQPYTTASLGYIFAADTLLCKGPHVSRGSPGALTHDWKQAEYRFL